MTTASPGYPALGAMEVAQIGTLVKANLTADDRGKLTAWRQRATEPNVIARIDELLAP
jgi:hypothetical protein